jgi:hypothetical protein
MEFDDGVQRGTARAAPLSFASRHRPRSLTPFNLISLTNPRRLIASMNPRWRGSERRPFVVASGYGGPLRTGDLPKTLKPVDLSLLINELRRCAIPAPAATESSTRCLPVVYKLASNVELPGEIFAQVAGESPNSFSRV